MREIEFFRWFTVEDRSRQVITTEGGEVIGFVVQYEAEIVGQWRAIVRYDTAHGFVHRDLVRPDGRVVKRRLGLGDLKEALVFGEMEIARNWRRHRERFVRQMGEGQ